jgi:hypothetical protein
MLDNDEDEDVPNGFVLPSIIALPITFWKIVFSIFVSLANFVVELIKELRYQNGEKKKLIHIMNNQATSYKEWEEAAFRLDEFNGNDIWKKVRNTFSD